MNFFSHNPLNRFSELRPDETHMQQLWQQQDARILVMHDSLSLIRETETGKLAAVLRQQEAEELAKLAQVQVYLGSEDGVPYFVLGFEGMQEQLHAILGESYSLADLRTSAMELPQPDSALLAYARGMVHWNLRHRFCPNCGSLTYSTHAGHVRQCTNQNCNRHHFPRTDTAIIVVISEGDACLLGRQAVWPKGMYATIAGFLEPGETLEQAVAREAQEETGVELQTVTYHSSQPWPFPSSVMVGFSAVARNRNLKLDSDELEDARWFTRSEIAAGLQDGSLRLPPLISIAYRLIRDWFNADPAYKLEELTGY
ncbi:NAD(+) diphosphatase [Pontibacter diazotrophicus]|uniref:NAD(+) diphosphatase n=1 Tax=Pontibacter diazotrophicus TaxID=1400979 RepID=A0A3D8LCC8_9BACT|nr:NAD(+) diphosphatase [Pontibacter diazotrophicus]RDV15003.1 NAD(+) diphosphatase [Pontibacter diazotrophicus]